MTVDGTHRQNINVTVDVPADAYAKGYDDCRLSLGYNRGEPWDSGRPPASRTGSPAGPR